MALLVGRNDTGNFTGTFGYTGSSALINFNGAAGATAPQNAVASGSADKLGLYINSWGSQTNIKVCIYDNSKALLETVIVNSSVGTGSVLIDLAGTNTITSGNNYYCGFYLEADTATTLYVDTSTADQHRSYSTSGSYSSPVDPIPNGSFISSDREFAWWLESAGAQISSITDPVTDGSTGNTLNTTLFGSDINSLTIEDVEASGDHQIDVSASLSGTGDGPYTWDMPDASAYTVDTLGTPFDSTYWSHTATAGDGTDTSLTSIVVNPEAGWARQDLAESMNMAEGSVTFGWTGLQEATTGVTVEANPILQGLDGAEWVTGQEVTLSGFTTTPDINGVQALSVSGSVVRISGVTTTVVTDGVGVALSGATSEHGQFYYPTASNTVLSADGTLETDIITGTISMLYFDTVDSKWKPFDVVLSEEAGISTTANSLSLSLRL